MNGIGMIARERLRNSLKQTNNMTEQISYECTHSGCGAGMETYTDFNGNTQKHKVSLEVTLGVFTSIKRGQMIPNKKCHKCELPTLIRV